MKLLKSGVQPDRTAPLVEVWEQAFTGPSSWRASLYAGMRAVTAQLDRDGDVSDSCILAQLPDSVEGPLVWHRELVRGRIIATMVGHWYRCGGPRVPELSFEMFLGEVCTLLQDRMGRGGTLAGLAEEAVALWGREPAAKGSSASVGALESVGA